MSEASELDVLERLVPELEAEGYDVYLHPNKRLVPAFFGGFPPDAIALRDDKNLVVEVTGGQSPNAQEKIERIQRLLHGQDKWELRVVWIEPGSDQKGLPIGAPDEMTARISEIRKFAAEGHLEPAMLLAWATFEALARAVLPKKFERPQTPGRIVQVLAAEGYVTPTEADKLRALAKKRNRLVHGDLQLRVSEEELRDFAIVLDLLLEQVQR